MTPALQSAVSHAGVFAYAGEAKAKVKQALQPRAEVNTAATVSAVPSKGVFQSKGAAVMLSQPGDACLSMLSMPTLCLLAHGAHMGCAGITAFFFVTAPLHRQTWISSKQEQVCPYLAHALSACNKSRLTM